MRFGEVKEFLEQGTKPLLDALRSAGVRMSYQRALRCVKDGIGGIRLPAVRIAGRWHTTPEAVCEFIALTTAKALRRSTDAHPQKAPGTGVRYLRALGLDRRSLNESGKPPLTQQPDAAQDTEKGAQT